MVGDPLSSALQPGDYHVFADGRVLITGSHLLDAPQHGFEGVYNLVWYTNEGRLDTTRIHRAGNGLNMTIKELPAGTPDDLGGRFLVDTWGSAYEGQPVDKVFRIHSDGSLDTTFRSHIEWGYVWEIEPLPDGRAYLGGAFRMEGGSDTLCVIREMPDGSLDTTFNNALRYRKRPEATANYPGVTCVYPIAPGLLALTGSFSEVDDVPRGSICMIDTTGQLVQAYFDGAGCGSYPYFTSVYATINGITEAPNGDYYIWGAYHGYTDGTTNDTLQRMVTRLHGGEIGLGLPQAQDKPMVKLAVHPNPANAWVVMTYDLPDAIGPSQLLVRDAMGRVMHQSSIAQSSGQVLLDTRDLPAGAYVIEVRQQGTPVVSERLIIQP